MGIRLGRDRAGKALVPSGSASITNAAVSRSLSAIGSRIAPTRVGPSQSRAMRPSSRSVTPAAMKRPRAHPVLLYPTAMMKKGMPAIRRMVRTLARVRPIEARSTETLSRDGRLPPPSRAFRSCARLRNGTTGGTLVDRRRDRLWGIAGSGGVRSSPWLAGDDHVELRPRWRRHQDDDPALRKECLMEPLLPDAIAIRLGDDDVGPGRPAGRDRLHAQRAGALAGVDLRRLV